VTRLSFHAVGIYTCKSCDCLDYIVIYQGRNSQNFLQKIRKIFVTFICFYKTIIQMLFLQQLSLTFIDI